MKPQPPEYPRNVPDIDLEEDILLPGATIYTRDEDDAGDAEELAKIRAAKKRRIEANAHAYLRGEGLFILSAGLRGPFDNGWRNPWAPRVKNTIHEAVTDETAVSRAQRMLKRDHLGSQTPWKSTHARQPAPVNPFERTRSEHLDQPSPEQKVENWLRRNSALPHQSFPEPTSPTPKKNTLPSPRPRSVRRDWTPTKQLITVNSQDVKAPVHHPDQHVIDSFETIVANEGRQHDPVHAHSRLQNALEATSPATARKRPASPDQATDEGGDESVRAEAAIIKMKRRRVDAGSMTAEHSTLKNLTTDITMNVDDMVERSTRVSPDQDMGESDYDKHPPSVASVELEPELSATFAPEVKLKKLEASIDDQLQQSPPERDHSMQLDGREEQAKVRRMMPPPPSTAVSEVQSTNLIPSAQPRPELQTSTSDISSSALLVKLDETNTDPSAVRPDVEIHEHMGEPVVADVEGTHEQNGYTEGRVPSYADVLGSKQQPLDSISQPKEKDETIEAQGAKVPSISPSPTKKAKVSNKRKSASFATEQSSLPACGSIKSVLKVQKAGQTSRSFTKASPPPFLPDHDIDMDTFIEQDDELPHSPKQQHRPDSTMMKPAKGILKTTNTPSSAVLVASDSPLKTRDYAGSSRDLLVNGQSGIAHEEEDFDLDGAINEMGSFLSTWDEEKGRLRVS